MKRFQFRLQRVLALKIQHERMAEMRQQQARARWEEARRECHRIETEIAHMAARATERLREAALLGTWQAPYEQTARLSELLAAAQSRLAETEQLLQEANCLRIQATQEVETLRNLRAQEWQAYLKETARQQQNKLDELGLQRWLAAQRSMQKAQGKKQNEEKMS